MKRRKIRNPRPGGRILAASNEAKKSFNDLLIESLLEWIESGEVVLRFLELKSAIKRDEIAEKPEQFANELEDLFGDGAKIIEEKVIQTLYAKIGMDYIKKEGYMFSDYIKEAYRKGISSYQPQSTQGDAASPAYPPLE